MDWVERQNKRAEMAHKERFKRFHQELVAYGSLTSEQKTLVVSGLILVLHRDSRRKYKWQENKSCAQNCINIIEENLKLYDSISETDREKLLKQFEILKTNEKLNEFNNEFKASNLEYLMMFLSCDVIEYPLEESISKFYDEFMRKARGDGQDLGIVLTPPHILLLVCEILNLKAEDKIFEPCCGTADFLKLCNYYLTEKCKCPVHPQTYGMELKENLYALSISNMIINSCDNFKIKQGDFLKTSIFEIQKEKFTAGFLNPPYALGKVDKSQYEIAYVKKFLDCFVPGGRAAIVVPQSTMIGKSKTEIEIKKEILEKHTLEGVITLNPKTFFSINTSAVIAVFKTHEPHEKNFKSKFIDFQDDGLVPQKHNGLVDMGESEERRCELLEMWRGTLKTSKCIETEIDFKDEWLHSYFWFNDEIPTDDDFEKTVGEYLTFEFSMIMQGREDLFGERKQ